MRTFAIRLLGVLALLSVPQIGALPALPFEELEAEAGTTTGQVTVYETDYYTIGAEASGRRYVELSAAGQSLSLRPKYAWNSLVVRFCLPDSEAGTGTKARLKLSSPGFPDAYLDLDSRLAWVYGPFPWTNNPADDYPHKFWDEAGTLLPGRPAGTPLTLTVVQAEDWPVALDLADFEQVAPPLPPPAGSLNVRDFGAKGDGTANDTAAFRQALAEAEKTGSVLYLPAGTYAVGALTAKTATVQGAGLWHTRLIGPQSKFNCTGGTVHFADFALFGQTAHRDDKSSRDLAFGGAPGPGSSLTRIWVEHKKCAFWVGNGGNTPTTGLVIDQCRFRNLMADAVNFCNGTSASIVKNSHIRYSGDDALATWSAPGDPACRNNTFAGNFIQLPWLASCISLYGGSGHHVLDNYIADTVHTGSGVYVTNNFKASPLAGSILVQNNTLVRCGTAQSDQGGAAGALRVLAWDAPVSADIRFISNTVLDSVRCAISIGGPFAVTGVVFTGTTVKNPGALAVEFKDKANGRVRFERSVGFGPADVHDSSRQKLVAEWAP